MEKYHVLLSLQGKLLRNTGADPSGSHSPSILPMAASMRVWSHTRLEDQTPSDAQACGSEAEMLKKRPVHYLGERGKNVLP